MNTNAKRDERRRRAMREVLEAVCRLRDRLMELSSQTPSGEPTGNVWSWMRLRDEVQSPPGRASADAGRRAGGGVRGGG